MMGSMFLRSKMNLAMGLTAVSSNLGMEIAGRIQLDPYSLLPIW